MEKSLFNVQNGRITTGNSEKQAIQNISQALFNAEIQLHITHLQAVHKSFEIHNALGAYYEQLGEFNDDLVEKSYCKVGMLDSYGNMPMVNNLEPLPYIKSLMATIERNRGFVSYGYIQQIIDNILDATAHVIYKLENLQ